MELKELNETIQELGQLFEQFKTANDTRIEKLEKGMPEPILVESIEKMQDRMDELGEMKLKFEDYKSQIDERVDQLQVDAQRIVPQTKEAEIAETEYKQLFDKWMRTGEVPKNELLEKERAVMEAKAVTIGTATAGGHGVPESIAQQILAKVVDLSPFRGLVRVTPVGTSDYKRLVDTRGTASGWAGEGTTRAESATPAVQQVSFTHGELYAVPKASEWSLDDVFFNVENWIAEGVAKEFAFQEGVAICTGDGTNKPTGFNAGTPETADDGARTFGELEYLFTGVSADWAASNPSDILFDLIYQLKPEHRAQGRFVFDKGIIRDVRKFKDADGDYIWRAGLAAGQPDTLLGYPTHEMAAMPAKAANSFSVAFGDFFEGYELVDIVGMRMTRDEVTEKGHILFYVRRRLGGGVTNDDAIKLIKFGIS